MSTSTPPPPVRRSSPRAVGGRGVAPVALLVLALGQPVATACSTAFGGAFTTADRPGEPPIVPAGWTFTIWSLVIVLAVAYAIWALPARRPDPDLRARLALPLAVVCAGFSVWLVAAEIEPVWTTLVVFAVMLAGLLVATRVAVVERARIAAWPATGRGLLWTLLGVYLGWSSIAIWVNLATAFAGSGAPIDGALGVAAQAAVLLGALATALALVRFTRGLLAYGAAVLWAFAGAAAGAAGAGEPVLAGLAVLAAVVVVAVVVRSRRGIGARRSRLVET